tara:strand:+ start:118 stop:765 length:648 start_codon:yes stop_codon:yes gene_type:complete
MYLINEKTAEFFGIVFGDGYLNNYKREKSTNYVLEIAGHSINDKTYLSKYVLKLCETLFNKTPKLVFKKDQQTMYIRINSKAINNFMIQQGFIKGKKKKMELPEWIKNNDNYMRFFIRGVTDTDGSVCPIRKRNYPRIRITNTNFIVINEIHKWLEKMGIKHAFGERETKRNGKSSKQLMVEINGFERTKKFIELIGFKNPKHINKYNRLIQQKL